MNNSSSHPASLLNSKKADSSKEDRPHHPYSPSTLQNLEWCPHWRSRQDAAPHHRAVAGTRAHQVADTGEDDQRLTDEDALAAAECVDFVEQRRRVILDQGGPVTELKETYLPIDDLVYPDAEATTAGYVDHAILNYNHTYAEMFDWKFGFWPVESADNNLQGIAYALGLFRKYPTLNEIRFFFKQPHLQSVSDATFRRSQVNELHLRVKTVVARAREARWRNNFSMARPGVPVCNFCGELGRCDKVCDFACKVGRKFVPLEMPEDITPTQITSPQQTALGLRLAAVLKIWCDAFRHRVTDRILRGDAPLPAGQVIQRMAKRELVDMAKLRTVALRYLTQQEYESTLETTFGALETLISEKAPRGQKKNTVEEFQKALLDCGAVKMGDEFAFLRAVAIKDLQSKSNT